MRMMIGELAHRSKNLLAVVQAMVRQTARHAEGMEAFTEQLDSRITGLAKAHDLLIEQNWAGVRLADLVAGQLLPFVTLPDPRVTVAGPPLMIEPQATQYLALALHELATNSTKHGALSRADGAVGIEWAIDPDELGTTRFRFKWSEMSGMKMRQPKRRGFGMFVLEQVVPTGLSAQTEFQVMPQGMVWTVTSEKASFCRLIESRGSSTQTSAGLV